MGEGRDRDKEDERQDKTRREDTAEHSSASNRTWKLEESRVDKSKGKDDRVNTVVSRQPMVKEEDTTGQLPFVQAIMDVNIFEHFAPPNLASMTGRPIQTIISRPSPYGWHFEQATG